MHLQTNRHDSQQIPSQTYLVLNATLGTTSDLDTDKKPGASSEDESIDEEDEDESAVTDEDEDEEATKRRIITCDIKSFEISSNNENQKQKSGVSPTIQSKTPQFVSINYLSTNMNSLLEVLLNNSNRSSNDGLSLAKLSIDLGRFEDKFNLVNFNRKVAAAATAADFTVNTDCIKQFKETTLTFTEPLCSIDFDSSTELYDSLHGDEPGSGSNDDEDTHDEISDETSSASKSDLFSVYSSLRVNSLYRIHVAASCGKQKRQIRNSAPAEEDESAVSNENQPLSMESAHQANGGINSIPVEMPGRFNSVLKSSNVVDLHNIKLAMKNVTHQHHNHHSTLDKKVGLMRLTTMTSTTTTTTNDDLTTTTTIMIPARSSSTPHSSLVIDEQTSGEDFVALSEEGTSTLTTTIAVEHKFGKPSGKINNRFPSNIDNCVVSNENELKFKLDTNLNEYVKFANSQVKHVIQTVNGSSFDNRYQYEIEILVPEPSLKATIRTLASYYTNLTKFRMGVENGIQVNLLTTIYKTCFYLTRFL
jgi:hypothetical protein